MEVQPKRIYPWMRFWCPRGESFHSDGAYLHAPGKPSYRLQQTNLRSSSELADLPCLILLGEPGTGKSAALSAAATEGQKAGKPSKYIDLAAFASIEDLARVVFDPEAISALDGGGELSLFLDSLDEARLDFPKIHHSLIGRLKELPAAAEQRLKLRIGCRTADWPRAMEEALIGIYGVEYVKAYEILPLTRNDVVVAAETEGLDASLFHTKIDERGLQPLAAKPVTLRLLLRLQRDEGDLPSRLFDVYSQGALALADDLEARQDGRTVRGNLDARQRLAIAGRLAAMSIFGGRRLFTLDGSVGGDRIGTNEATGGEEQVEGAAFPVTAAEVREVLGTGLFTGGPDGTVGWSHQTFAEFLAASFIASKRLDKARLRSLFYTPFGAIVPQLAETAAWLAVSDSAFADGLSHDDPGVLLKSDVALDDGTKAALAVGLLDQYEAGLDAPWMNGLKGHFAKLMHPGLAAIVSPVIVDQAKSNEARTAAVMMAAATDLREAAPAIADLALSETVDLHLRRYAIGALARLDVPEQFGRLRELMGPDRNDPPAVKQAAMIALWPTGLLSLSEVLEVLPAPGPIRSGTLGGFMWTKPFEALPMADLPALLEWAVGDIETTASYLATDEIDDFFVMAIPHVSNPEVLRALVSAISALCDRYISLHRGGHHKTETLLEESPTERHALLQALIPLIRDDRSLFQLRNTINLPISDDRSWLIQYALSSNDPEIVKSAILMAAAVTDFSIDAEFCEIYEAADHSSIIQSVLRGYAGPIELDGPVAKSLQEHLVYLRRSEAYQEQLQDEQDRQIREMQANAASLTDLLGKAETDPNLWPVIDQNLNLPTASHPEQTHIQIPIAQTPNWQSADPLLRERLETILTAYLRDGDVGGGTWLRNTSDAFYEALAVLKAFEHVLDQGLGQGIAPPTERWGDWAPAIVSGFHWLVPDDAMSRLPILETALSLAHDQTIAAIKLSLDAVMAGGGRDWLVETFLKLNSPQVLDHLRGWVRKVDSPAGARRALNGLYSCDPAMALEAAAESLRAPPATPEETAHSLEIAVSIFEIDAVKSWSLVEPRLHDDAWARTFWSRYAGVTRMSVPGIAEAETSVRFAAVSQLFELFPSKADPQHDGIFVSDNRDDLAHMRNGIVRAFVTAGTDADLAALEELRRAFPQERWIGFWRHDALAANHAARNAWIPPSDLLKLVTSARGRLVRSDDELMEVCLEVLAEYEGELHGMRPRCRELWNETPGDFRPKDEGAFTDHVAVYFEQQLKQNGAIINREVEIRSRSGVGGVKGERTDILIQARDPVNQRRFDVVIEGKGCWNKGLMTDMDGQLAGRYLKENQCTHGIYLVGWFVCPQWGSKDYRLADTGKGTLADLREALQADAKAVGRKHRAVIRSAVIDAGLR